MTCGTEGEEHRVIMSEFWSWRLREVPEFASSVGVHDFDDRLETFTLEAFRKRKVLARVVDTEMKFLLWLPCIADVDIYFCSMVSFYLSFYLFPCLISVVAEWMSTTLLQVVWP